MSKRFRIVKRISKEDTGHFEDIEVDDDFVDNEMVQIIADNEYDPLYDDCESIAVALQLAGYGKVADLEAKLAESKKSKESYRLQNEQHHLQLLQFYSRLGVEAFGADIHEKALETLMIMKEQLAEKDIHIRKLEEENKQLKQSQKHLAIEQLEKVEEILWNSQDIGNVIDNDKFLEKLNYLIKSLKGE